MPRRSHRLASAAAVVAIAAVGATVALQACVGSDTPRPAGAAADRTTPAPEAGPATWGGQPDVPVEVDGDLWVGGEQVPGEWWGVEGRGTRWIGVQLDRTWWWGNDAQPRRMEGEVDQGPAISASGRYLAYVVGGGREWTAVAVDTDDGGHDVGTVELPHERMSPAPRAVAVTDDGLVVVGGPRFQWVWRPLVDGATVELARAAPGQAVVGSTAGGLVVNEGRYDRTDGAQGAPYLARIAEDGTLRRLGPVPTHDALEASEQWLAYAPPGTLGGEAWGPDRLQVQRLDGSRAGVLAAPDGWRFNPSDMQWETAGGLLVVVVSPDGDEALARCRPDKMTCTMVDLPD
ncbi:hypothetical protein [Nocardioides sp. Soil774]|uniref:hypothetical protein n=1 Tax=Nocardioides sp. Soil774 TaxID=1736408 RepID=UPI000AC36D16|nr:hypothetical protein [Nocardioides sp. Soil774]